MLRIAQDNPSIFSKTALARRKQQGVASRPNWLAAYLADAYEPSADDFRRIRAHVTKYRRIYENNYRDLRHRVFAHKGLSDSQKISALFARTNIREMQRMLTFLMALHESLWQLFHNGRKPVLRPVRYSVASMRRKASAAGGRVHERLVREIQEVLLHAARSP